MTLIIIVSRFSIHADSVLFFSELNQTCVGSVCREGRRAGGNAQHTQAVSPSPGAAEGTGMAKTCQTLIFFLRIAMFTPAVLPPQQCYTFLSLQLLAEH